MFEVATNEAHRDAIARAHAERAAVFAAGFAWIGSFFRGETTRAPIAPAASAH